MRRFVYAPDVNVYIASDDLGFIDLSPDVISGTVTRRVSAVSNASITVQNPYRKYLKKIKPMDRIVIYLTRIHKPVLVFSGYVDRSPWDQLYPGPVTITASCTLKRLLYTYWDPGLPFVQKWLAQYGWFYDTSTGTMLDPARNLYNFDYSGGLGHMLRAVLNEVGGWPIGSSGVVKGADPDKNTVQIMPLPKKFLTVTKKMLQAQLKSTEEEQDMIDEILETLMSFEGVSSTTTGDGTSASNIKIVDNVRDNNPLPIDASKRSYDATIFGEKVVGASTISAREINTYLAGKGSPLEGFGADFVEAGATYKIDPRLLVAITGQETSFAKTGNATSIHNAWGWGPNVNFPDWTTGITTIARGLSNGYIGEGRTTIAEIGAKWAPIGAGNDPGNLNSNWVTGVSRFYKELGGNPDTDVRLLDVTKGSSKRQGKIGDVKTSIRSFFDAPRNQNITAGAGRTFRIRGNPYGDDTLLFRAVYDANVPAGTLNIYVPGAANKGTVWAQNWKNTSVTVETSAGKDDRFPSQGSSTTTKDLNQQSITTTGSFMYPIADYIGFKHVITPEGYFGNNRGDHIHAGVDIPAAQGAELVAVVTGTVVANQTQSGIGGGNYIVIKDAKSNATYTYMHMNEPSPLSVGTAVKQGQVIGHVGHSGTSSGFNHLHFEYHPNGGASPANLFGAGSAADPAPMLAKAWKSDTKQISGQAPVATSNAGGGGNVAGISVGDSGVQVTDEGIAGIAAASTFGIELGFPAIADVMESENLTGHRALANDVPLFEWVEFIAKASGREFQSLPNGDFLAFYPDYFNWADSAPYFRISPIETIDLTIDIGDEELTTHVFTTGDTFIDGQITLLDKLASTVASVEQVGFLEQLLNIKDFNPTAFLNRYGARPWQENRPEIKNSLLQFMYGWRIFLEKWAKQFYCNAEFTFMPELFPGGLVEFGPPHNLTLYLQEVTHSFDRASGFTTSASMISPALKGKNASSPAMVLSGGSLAPAKGASKALPSSE
jgi:murein DD-endopeptidase MepM/ murein hydrolase activator NlpD